MWVSLVLKMVVVVVKNCLWYLVWFSYKGNTIEHSDAGTGGVFERHVLERYVALEFRDCDRPDDNTHGNSF